MSWLPCSVGSTGGGSAEVFASKGSTSASLVLQPGTYIVSCDASGGVGGGYNGSSYAGINWHLSNYGLSNIGSLDASVLYNSGVYYGQGGIWVIVYKVILELETTITMTCATSGSYNPNARCILTASKI